MTTTTNHLPAGTKVLNTNDGEPGTVLNGYATGPDGEWTEHEVETAHGIEIWKAGELRTAAAQNNPRPRLGRKGGIRAPAPDPPKNLLGAVPDAVGVRGAVTELATIPPLVPGRRHHTQRPASPPASHPAARTTPP